MTMCICYYFEGILSSLHVSLYYRVKIQYKDAYTRTYVRVQYHHNAKLFIRDSMNDLKSDLN